MQNGTGRAARLPSSSSTANGSNTSQEPETRPQSELSKKVDVSHYPHYGLKRGMACTFCRRRKLRCSGDRPQCTNCVKYTKVCEYGPPDKSEKKKQSQQQQQQHQQQQQPQQQPHAQTQIYVAPQQHQPAYSNASYGNGMPVGAAATAEFTPLQQLHAGPMYDSLPGAPSVSTDYMNDMLMEPNMMGPGSYSANMTSYGAAPFGPLGSTDFSQPSPFVNSPMSTATSAGTSQQLMQTPTPSIPQQQHLAQPIIGMPPYVAPNGPESFSFPNASENTLQNPWSTAASASYPTPQNSTGYETAPSTRGQSQTSMFTDSSMTTEPMFDAAMSAVPEMTASITQVTSDPSTPDERMRFKRGSGTGSSGQGTPEPSNRLASRMYHQTNLHYVANLNPIDGLTERLGEFLFSPNGSAVKDDEGAKRARPHRASSGAQKAGSIRGQDTSSSVNRMRTEYDGLSEAARTILLDCFLAHATLFFEMSVPRFRYRLSFTDKRRPSLALLNVMYLWATRMSNSPQMVNMEKHFFEEACKHLEISTSTVDRLIDAVRAAMLLSAYSHSSGRHHEGWCLGGLANRLVLSCGLHRIHSNVHQPEPKKNPFLRNRVFLLPPPADAVELGERLHLFWAVLAIDRCSSLATGYSSGLKDEDISTPFARHLTDVASGNVSERDDYTIRDLYRGRSIDFSSDTAYTKWVKCVVILERASKLSFLEPADDSPYAQAWNQYRLTLHRDPMQAPPPEHLNQPRFRNPRDYRECLLAIDQLVAVLGVDGVFPVERNVQAQQNGAPEPQITTNILMLHHMIAAVYMMLHDINSLDVDNTEALKAARKSVMLFRNMPQLPFTDVDAFLVLIWSLNAKVLIKEAHRLMKLGKGDSARAVAAEAETIIGEMTRIGETMYVARTQAEAVKELKEAALSPAGNTDSMPQLESFMFPQHM
ncbi:uncharacterized protein CcaverHIS019_0110730 [Cutaneotrichosporon cavernicola]|uniref:Zn(2)-C6 fungal-type domain-containing protein n=1 Tax=Cutaneotrichosporon cavernicola TaxID=279322 RepID=A0AA48L0K8_9TREE|nr:uncharacterized protein CcaverHIS019_0110730 [Cutaneotrichosporon cavernicola]BEI88355.1 hypothetical protein CcaverHIS019_0110730 [Cutaneotrichosporon cavernicola]